METERHQPRTGFQLIDPPGQNWTELEQPGTPQQNNFTNTKETSLACGIYTVLSTLYAVRNWKIDFTQQAHIKKAELIGSSRPRDKGNSEPAPVQVWREIRTVGQSTTSPLPHM